MKLGKFEVVAAVLCLAVTAVAIASDKRSQLLLNKPAVSRLACAS